MTRAAPLLFVVLVLVPVAAETQGDEIAATLEKLAEADETALLEALDHEDWEVVEFAAVQLGKRGTAAAVPDLVKLALRGPVRRIRRAAAESAKALDPVEATKRLAKKARGSTAIVAADALDAVGHPDGRKALAGLLRHREGDVRELAVRALGRLRDPELKERFVDSLKDEDVRVRAAAVAGLVLTGDVTAVRPLRDGLKDANLSAVMERRYIAGIRELLKAQKDTEKRDFEARMCARAYGSAGSAPAAARFARLFGLLGRKDGPVGPVEEYRDVLIGPAVGHADAGVRSAAVKALGDLGLDASYERVASIAKADSSEVVRFHALRAAVRLRGAKAEELILDRVEYDRHPMVREEAAVYCGKLRLEKAVGPLIKRLKDAEWTVATCAAVSLGMLRDPRGLPALIEMAAEKDWRLRASAATGLGWIRQKSALPVLIDLLKDRELAVVATAREFLCHATGESLPPKQKTWKTWWTTKGKAFVFVDRDKAARDQKKYGYAVQPRKVYEDLDIIVLQTRKGGDNIQFLLDDYGIDHRIVRAASLKKAGLHPHALFVANCPGEVTNRDVARVQWYVRAGGYLFASCWALTHTVEKAFPGVVRKLETKAQIVDTVRSTPVPSTSPLIKGVFDKMTRPLYELVGSHVIDVVDPERFEVLVDSPECATRWGDGNLAGWFSIGHGVVLDSANHFDMQGMKQAKVKTERDRMAFAVDHLGYDYARLRKLQAEGVFAKQPLAVKKTRDLSIFRFITTFVRQKRLSDDR